jgi:RAB protein geranylgeranyltransferase component A
MKTEEFLEKVFVFIKSMGIHSKYPFLYTNYGTGDIS